ncbi:MAG: hypothetical protein R6W89_01795 [Candidatus Hydrogenedentota bacterium]
MNFFWRNAAVERGELFLRAPDRQLITDHLTGAGPHEDEYGARRPIEHEVSENSMALDPDG